MALFEWREVAGPVVTDSPEDLCGFLVCQMLADKFGFLSDIARSVAPKKVGVGTKFFGGQTTLPRIIGRGGGRLRKIRTPVRLSEYRL